MIALQQQVDAAQDRVYHAQKRVCCKTSRSWSSEDHVTFSVPYSAQESLSFVGMRVNLPALEVRYWFCSASSCLPETKQHSCQQVEDRDEELARCMRYHTNDAVFNFGGHNAIRLVEAIQHNAARFHMPPLGPIGNLMALTDPR